MGTIEAVALWAPFNGSSVSRGEVSHERVNGFEYRGVVATAVTHARTVRSSWCEISQFSVLAFQKKAPIFFKRLAGH